MKLYNVYYNIMLIYRTEIKLKLKFFLDPHNDFCVMNILIVQTKTLFLLVDTIPPSFSEASSPSSSFKLLLTVTTEA